MSKIHIWAGNFESENELNHYLDQSDYLRAWAVYDNEPPTGDAATDAEPSPELRCQFCKENGLDDYDPDTMTYCFAKNGFAIKEAASITGTDTVQLSNLVNKGGIDSFNALIAYEDDHLKPQKDNGQKRMYYLGCIEEDGRKSDSIPEHYLWAGETKVNKNEALKMINLTKDQLIAIKCQYTTNKKRLDEFIVIEVPDFDLAERMVLAADSGNFPTEANTILLITIKPGLSIDGLHVGKLLGLEFIGSF